jgi:hypothetical protein
MGRTFHVKRSEKTNKRSPVTPLEWHQKKRRDRKLGKTYLNRMVHAEQQYNDAKAVDNTARAKKFLKILDRTQARYTALIEGE